MPETIAGGDTFASLSFCGCADHSDLIKVIEPYSWRTDPGEGGWCH